MRVKWEVNLGAVIVAAPVVAPDGTLCVIAGNHLRAVGPDGALLWSLDLAERGHARRPGLSSEGFTPQSAVLAPDGTLYQTLGGFLACVLAVDTSPQAAERLKWVSKGTETRSSPLFVEGTLFTGVREGVRAFDTGSEGKATWRQAGPYYTSSSLARSPDGATLYVGGSDGNLHALDSATGQRKWSAGRSERAGVRLAEKDARGKTMRHFTTAGHIPEAPAVGPDGTIYFGSWDGYLRAASPDGRIRWSIDLKDRLTSAPALGADGRILISTFEGTLYAVRVVDGRPVVDWQAEANSRYSSPLISSDGKAYVGTMDGRLRAYALADGGKAGDLAPGSSDPSVLPGWITASPVPGGDGVLYIGGSDGFLRAVE
ncbi:MAG: PQQ-binding-like beta-propeller repeat protein [Armatimonadetes bacterium]|nr:PQQ-binding-like beta-propeller repeat protein [Armatimonadota bacterium]